MFRKRCEELETENECLKNEKRTIIEQRESADDLRRYVEDELSYREAGLVTRTKWCCSERVIDANDKKDPHEGQGNDASNGTRVVTVAP